MKYRPPNNRDPLPEEKKAFLPYLKRQIAILQPKIIVTLGRHATNCFLPDMLISQIHGQPKRISLRLSDAVSDVLRVVIVPLYHPAAALYNGDMRATLTDDFMRIPQIIENI